MFHISDIKKYNKCHRYYSLSRKNKQNFFSFFRNDTSIVDIYKSIFDFDTCFVGKTGDDPKLVINEINNYSYFINARFAYGDLRVKTSLLIKNNNDYSLYFFKPMLPKELDIDSMYITFDILRKNNIHVTNIYLIYVNKDYILNDVINYKEALIITDSFNNEEIINTISNHSYDYESIINSLKVYNETDEFELNKNCTSCEFFEECHGNKLEDDSILYLVSSKYKYDMYQKGVTSLKDADLNLIDGTSLQYAQIMASRNISYFMDKPRLNEFLQSFNKKPITFIDFEWDSFLFPSYKGMKCFGILPFEFCMYVNDEDNNLTNYSYVGTGDCREEFINELINHLPKEGPIVAFNSFSAEVLRINELAEQFPKYSSELKTIAKRFVDLAEVFSKGMFYLTSFKGQLSLKKIMSIISDINYSSFNVKDGLDAIQAFRKYEITNDQSIKENLIQYCNQDAYSLYAIYFYLQLQVKL